MKITLGKDTFYVQKFTPRIALLACDLVEDALQSKGPREEAEAVRKSIDFIANTVFNGQFTPKRFMDEYLSETMMADIYQMLSAVRGMVLGKLAEFPHEDEDEPKNSQRDSKKKK